MQLCQIQGWLRQVPWQLFSRACRSSKVLAWHAARADVPFTASKIGVQLGFHGSKAVKVLEGSATVRSGGSGDAAAAYKQFYQPPQQQSAGLAMLWGSSHEVCGKITLLNSLYPDSHLR